MARIALVVPHIVAHGGVVSVARFVLRTLRDVGGHQVDVLSLTTSSTDPASVLLRRPATWLNGVQTQARDGAGAPMMFEGEPFRHFGAFLGEIETQRYKPRHTLRKALADADMIQVVAGAPSWAAPVLGLGVPVSLQVATLTAVERRSKMQTWRGPTAPYRRWITRQVSRLEDRVLKAVSAIQVENQWMYDHVRRINPSPTVDLRFAAPGVDEDRFRPADHRPDLPGYLLSVGRMSDPRKNHRLLVDAYHLLCQRVSTPPRLVLAGPDTPSDALMAQISQLGLTGQVDIYQRPSDDALATLYREATAFVLASDEEGFGVTVIEAMASGVPALCTRSGGPDDIITDAVDGILTECGDAAGLAEGMWTLVQDVDLNRSIGRQARETVLKRYGHKRAGQAFLDVAENLLSAAGKSGSRHD